MDDDCGKWLVCFEVCIGFDYVLFVGVILLDGSGGVIDWCDCVILLGLYLFCLCWLVVLLGYVVWFWMMLMIVDWVLCCGFDCGVGFYCDIVVVEWVMGLIVVLFDI